MSEPKVRACYRSVHVDGYASPYNNIALKVYYPCAYSGTFEERNTGFIAGDRSRAPCPVIIMMPGINVSHESYSWLCKKLAKSGFVVVSYSWIAEEIPGLVSITPGVDMQQLSPERYSQAPSCPAIPAILGELERMNTDGLLAGMINCGRVVLGGHSAGGTMALINANPRWFPGVCGAFSYAAHTVANVQLGWKEDNIMPLSHQIPLLIMGGTRDGVIAASGHRYGEERSSSPTGRIVRTFHEGVKGNRGGRYLVILEGANHFSMAWPGDDSTGRPFLDGKVENPKAVRKYLYQLIHNFCKQACKDSAKAATELARLCDGRYPMAAAAAHK